MPARKKSSEKLMTVNPSGKKDENFFELLFEVARQIPKGRVTSHGAIAACLATKSSARMVGWAMNGAGWEYQALVNCQMSISFSNH